MLKVWQPQGKRGVKLFLAFALIFGSIFCTIAVVFGVQSIYLLAHSDKYFGEIVRFDVVETDSTVCWHPVVRVLDKIGLAQSGMEVKSDMCSQAPDSDLGTLVPVLLPRNGQEPVVATFGDLWLFSLVFGGIGGIWLSIGAIPLFLIWKRMRRLAWLKTSALGIEISEPHLERNSSLTMNGQYPYRIVHEMDWNGQAMVFRSHNLWLDSSREIRGKVMLYIDKHNAKVYAFDVLYESK